MNPSTKQILESWYELWNLVYCSSSHYKLSSHSDWWKVEWGKVLSEPSIIQRGALQILSSCLRQGDVKLAKRLPMHGLLSVNLKLHELHFKHWYSLIISSDSLHHDVTVSPGLEMTWSWSNIHQHPPGPSRSPSSCSQPSHRAQFYVSKEWILNALCTHFCCDC